MPEWSRRASMPFTTRDRRTRGPGADPARLTARLPLSDVPMPETCVAPHAGTTARPLSRRAAPPTGFHHGPGDVGAPNQVRSGRPDRVTTNARGCANDADSDFADPSGNASRSRLSAAHLRCCYVPMERSHSCEAGHGSVHPPGSR